MRTGFFPANVFFFGALTVLFLSGITKICVKFRWETTTTQGHCESNWMKLSFHNFGSICWHVLSTGPSGPLDHWTIGPCRRPLAAKILCLVSSNNN